MLGEGKMDDIQKKIFGDKIIDSKFSDFDWKLSNIESKLDS